MKVGIVGYGFVGKALENGIDSSVSIMNVDPKLNNSIKDLIPFQPNIIFVCVPTPMSSDADQDISILQSVLNQIKASDIEALIVLKSTVLPNHLNRINNEHHNFVYNPEFLTEKNANDDFINSPLIVFGGNSKSNNKLAEFYRNYTKCKSKNYFYTDVISASLIKYTINSFLATKVIFFNELHDLFCNSGTADSWESFIEILSADPRIGSSHMKVPGIDNRFGFGGACFPKDTKALYEFSKSKNNELKLLNLAININNNIRSEYERPTKRESSQNITFKKNE